MKRFGIGLFILFLCAFALCQRPCLGMLLRAVAYFHSGSSLQYGHFYFSDGNWKFDDVIVSSPDSYTLRAEEVAVHYEWPWHFSIELKEPHLTLSPNIFQSASKISFAWTATVQDGLLDWVDDALPSGRFSLVNTADDLQIRLRLDQGTILFEKKRIVCTAIPLPLVERVARMQALPMSHASGVCDIDFDGNVLKASGKDLSFLWDDIECSGAFSLDLQRSDRYAVFPGLERLRLTINEGKAENVEGIELQASFQAGVGGKIECRAIADQIPMAFEGKAFFGPDGGWLEGDGTFGGAALKVTWNREGGAIHWENLGPKEMAVLQTFSSIDGEWISGVSSGKATYRDALNLEELSVQDLFIRTGPLKGGAASVSLNGGDWNVERAWVDEFQGDLHSSAILGTWRDEPVEICWNKNGQILGKVGNFLFGGKKTSRGIEIADGKGTLGKIEIECLRGCLSLREWSFYVKASHIDLSQYWLSDLAFELSADQNEVDLSGEGLVSVHGRQLPIKLHKCRIGKETAQFDVRLSDENWDLIRLVGAKNGASIEFDSEKTHLLGEQIQIKNAIWDQGALQSISCVAETNYPLKTHFSIDYNRETGCTFKGESSDWKTSGHWGVDGLRGSGQYGDVSFDYAGNGPEIHLTHIRGNCEQFSPVQGTFEGAGTLSLALGGIESDIELTLPKATWGEYLLENNHPLRICFSSANGVLVTGFEGKVSRGPHVALGRFERLKYDHSRVDIKRAQMHISTDFFPLEGIDPHSSIDFIGDLSLTSELSGCNIALTEAFIPIGGAMRAFENLIVYQGSNGWEIEAEYQSAKIVAEVSLERPFVGTVKIQDLQIDFRENQIDRIEGSFAGIDASFIGTGEELIGHAKIDFNQLLEWIPVSGLEIGDGYEFHGKYSKKEGLKGVLSGREFELFGCQFLTLQANVEWNESLKFSNIALSDSALSLHIDEVKIDQNISVPQITVTDFRPSLLRQKGKPLGELTPLQIRSLVVRDLRGSLDDPKTLTAQGTLSFINTFRRAETLFDLPANILGRIIGIDLELLVPVIGDLNLELKDGYVWLTDLKNAVSAGQRSEFFLVRTDTSPRMDLKGNLEVLIKTRQYVLFALTEGFLISIDGTLANPNVKFL